MISSSSSGCVPERPTMKGSRWLPLCVLLLFSILLSSKLKDISELRKVKIC